MKIAHKINSLLRVSENAWPGIGVSNGEISLYFGQNEALKKEMAVSISAVLTIRTLPASEAVESKRLNLHRGRKKHTNDAYNKVYTLWLEYSSPHRVF